MSRKLFSLIACLVLVFSFFVVQTPVQAEEVGGSISGMVIDQDTGVAIVGMEVAACPYDFDTGEFVGETCYSGWTEADGSYLIPGVPAGSYVVDSGWSGNWVVEIYYEQVDYSLADPVVVEADKNTPSINFTLEFGGSISGMVTEQGTGIAIEGMEVAACPYDFDAGEYVEGMCYSGWTEADGGYLIHGVPVGTYLVDSGWSGNWVVEIYKNTPFGEDAKPVKIQPAHGNSPNKKHINVTGIDFTLELGGSISGTVVNQDTKEGIKGMEVSACPYDFNAGEFVQGMPCYSGWTETNGSYFIRGVPAGTYIVDSGWSGNWIPEIYFEKTDYHLATPVVVESDMDTGGIDFTLEQGGLISGTVTAVGGGLVGDNIDVSACFEDDSFCGWTSIQSDGTYVITGLPAGDYRVHAYQYPEGYWIDEVYKETRDWDAYTPVTVLSGGEISSINFTLEYGGAITGVVGDGENGIEGIWVVAHDYSGDYFVSWAQTDATGMYRILGLPAGTYRVFVNPQNGWTGQEYSPSPVTITAGLDTFGINFMMALDSTISGTVTDVDGNHIPERIDVAACWATEPDDCFWTTVMADSTYTIIGLPSGEFYVNVYEVPEEEVPSGNWIGDTYPDIINLGIDEDVADINFKLVKGE